METFAYVREEKGSIFLQEANKKVIWFNLHASSHIVIAEHHHHPVPIDNNLVWNYSTKLYVSKAISYVIITNSIGYKMPLNSVQRDRVYMECIWSETEFLKKKNERKNKICSTKIFFVCTVCLQLHPNCVQWFDAILLILLTVFLLRQQFQCSLNVFSSFSFRSFSLFFFFCFVNRTVYFLTYWALTFDYFLFLTHSLPLSAVYRYRGYYSHFHIDDRIEIRQTFVRLCSVVYLPRIVSVDGLDNRKHHISDNENAEEEEEEKTEVIYLFKWPNAFIMANERVKIE